MGIGCDASRLASPGFNVNHLDIAPRYASILMGNLSLGFSRQEHWSGLPFPSPRHESEK